MNSDALILNPLLPVSLLAAAAAVTLVLAATAAVRGGRGWLWRALAVAVLLFALLDPRIVREQREAQPDVALIVVDESASQQIDKRATETEAALTVLQAALGKEPDLEVRAVRTDGRTTDGETRLIAAAERAAQEDSRDRIAAVVLLTDGQVHDVPSAPPPSLNAPVHVLLTGQPNELDRRIVIEQSPAYGLVGNEVEIGYRVEDLGPSAPNAMRVAIVVDGQPLATIPATAGRTLTLPIRLEHAGPTVVELEAEAAPGEISMANNRVAVVINGVRDRLRVLLISGQPHPGERTWRNLLKSDPAVDLVHFTILRPPEKDDSTPLKELSLIVFPVQELFEEKLAEFDLIVLDRYSVRGILSTPYYDRIAEYVRNGGALLASVGPEFAGPRSIARTGLATVLPATPSGRVVEQAFRPQLTAIGRRHPVTSGLPGETVAGDAEDGAANEAGDVTMADAAPFGSAGQEGEPTWGRWFRLIEARAASGTVIMTGAGDRPLLVLDRIGEGRVAHLLSDHIWLWARGYDGGGPQVELLRRLGHWLMKEPELEENRLQATLSDGRLRIVRRSLTAGDVQVTVTRPDGGSETVRLEDGPDGLARGETEALAAGLYRIGDGTQTAFAAAGRLNPPEFADMRATPDRLEQLARPTGGAIVWLADGLPQLRRVAPGRDAYGRGWIGLRRNEAFVVSGVAEIPLLPALAVLAAALALLSMAWWREGR